MVKDNATEQCLECVRMSLRTEQYLLDEIDRLKALIHQHQIDDETISEM